MVDDRSGLIKVLIAYGDIQDYCICERYDVFWPMQVMVNILEIVFTKGIVPDQKFRVRISFFEGDFGREEVIIYNDSEVVNLNSIEYELKKPRSGGVSQETIFAPTALALAQKIITLVSIALSLKEILPERYGKVYSVDHEFRLRDEGSLMKELAKLFADEKITKPQMDKVYSMIRILNGSEDIPA